METVLQFPPAKKRGEGKKDDLNEAVCHYLVLYECSFRFMLVFFFYAATAESTAAPGEETTAVPPGKTPNNIKKEKNIIHFKKLC